MFQMCVYLPVAVKAKVQTTYCTAMNREKCLSSLHIELSPDFGKFFFVEGRYTDKNIALTNYKHVQ